VPDHFLGPLVLVVRTTLDGVESEWLPALLAVELCGYDERNGDDVLSAHIVADDVDMGAWDRSP
jgi:hypothetical protein